MLFMYSKVEILYKNNLYENFHIPNGACALYIFQAV